MLVPAANRLVPGGRRPPIAIKRKVSRGAVAVRLAAPATAPATRWPVCLAGCSEAGNTHTHTQHQRTCMWCAGRRRSPASLHRPRSVAHSPQGEPRRCCDVSSTLKCPPMSAQLTAAGPESQSASSKRRGGMRGVVVVQQAGPGGPDARPRTAAGACTQRRPGLQTNSHSTSCPCSGSSMKKLRNSAKLSCLRVMTRGAHSTESAPARCRWGQWLSSQTLSSSMH
jgi:hypothetical protein